MEQNKMTMQEEERLVQLLTTKFNIDEINELTTLLKKDKYKVEILPIHGVNLHAYLVDLMGKHLVVLADNIADACDKLDVKGHEHYEFVRTTSIDVLY